MTDDWTVHSHPRDTSVPRRPKTSGMHLYKQEGLALADRDRPSVQSQGSLLDVAPSLSAPHIRASRSLLLHENSFAHTSLVPPDTARAALSL